MIANTGYTQLRKHACYVIKASGKSAHTVRKKNLNLSKYLLRC